MITKGLMEKLEQKVLKAPVRFLESILIS